MPWIKSTESYYDFGGGRNLRDALHREDNSPGEVVGWVEADGQRATDIPISISERDSIMSAIRAHNDTLPKPSTPKEQEAARLALREGALAKMKSWGLSDEEWSALGIQQ